MAVKKFIIDLLGNKFLEQHKPHTLIWIIKRLRGYVGVFRVVERICGFLGVNYFF